MQVVVAILGILTPLLGIACKIFNDHVLKHQSSNIFYMLDKLRHHMKFRMLLLLYSILVVYCIFLIVISRNANIPLTFINILTGLCIGGMISFLFFFWSFICGIEIPTYLDKEIMRDVFRLFIKDFLWNMDKTTILDLAEKHSDIQDNKRIKELLKVFPEDKSFIDIFGKDKKIKKTLKKLEIYLANKAVEQWEKEYINNQYFRNHRVPNTRPST